MDSVRKYKAARYKHVKLLHQKKKISVFV